MTGTPTAEQSLDAHLADVPLVAILRSRHAEHLGSAIETLVDCGIRAVEVTVPTPGAWDAVRRAGERYGAALSIGFGTVLSTTDVENASAAAARFIVTPHTDPAVIAAARQHGLAVLPGAFTPTEIAAASTSGATAVKIFPARSLGPAYVADLLAPMPDLKVIPVGGVELEDMSAYLAAGAYAVGVGSPLIGSTLDDGDLRGLAGRATAYITAARLATKRRAARP